MKTYYGKVLLLLLTGLLTSTSVLAQSPDDKQALATRVLALWHVENSAIGVFERTGAEVLRNTAVAVRGRLPADKQEAVLKDAATDVAGYVEQLTPFVMESAESVKDTVFMPFLMENFNERELEDLIRILESPAKQKLDELLPAVQGEYEKKVVEASSSRVKPALTELTEGINSRLRQAAGSP